MHTWNTGVSAVFWGRGRHSMCGSGTVWHKEPVCSSSMDAAETCQLIERQVGGCRCGGYKPIETPRAVTNLHTETTACSASRCGRYTFNQRKLDCTHCLWMQFLWTSNQIVSHCVAHCTVSYCIVVYHNVTYHVISLHISFVLFLCFKL